MKKFWFISDTHFGHGNILKYCKRPFMTDGEIALLENGVNFKVCQESIDLMDNFIIENINAVVKENDILWHLGDFAFGDYEKVKSYRDRIRCKEVHLVVGNHDKSFVKDLFSSCISQGGSENSPLRVNGKNIWMNHYPQMSWHSSHRGAWMLHGHVHGCSRLSVYKRNLYDRMYICDVGVDGPCVLRNDGVYNHKFKPWSEDELNAFMAEKIVAEELKF